MGPGKDTHGTPEPTVGRPWVARSRHQPVSSSSTNEMQKLFNIFSVFLLSPLMQDSRAKRGRMQDSRAKRGRDVSKVQEARLLTVHCVDLPSSRTKHSLVQKKKTSICSLSSCHHRMLLGSESFHQVERRVIVHKISRCILPLRCTLPLLCFFRLLS